MSVVCIGLIKDDPEELLDNHAAIIPRLVNLKRNIYSSAFFMS
jgi:hypothetical protein